MTTQSLRKKSQVKKVGLAPLKQNKLVKQNSLKSPSSQNSKSPTNSTLPSSKNLSSLRRIIDAPKIQNKFRRQTFTEINDNKRYSTSVPRLIKAKNLPATHKSEVMLTQKKVKVTNKSFVNLKCASKTSQLLSDFEISQLQLNKLEIKLTGFNMGDKSFEIELNQMSSKFGIDSLINLIIKGDKECKLKDSGVAQLVFNIQKYGSRIVELELQLNWNDITDIGAKHIGNGLTYLPNLRSLKLHLGHNQFGHKSANCIANGIRSLMNLNNLEIDVTNYSQNFKMEDVGVNSIFDSIGPLRYLKQLKLFILGQQITTNTFDYLLRALKNKPYLTSLVIDKDYGQNEEYIGIPEQKFQQLLEYCPNLINLKICRLSFSKNTKQTRSQFFLSLFQQEYLTDFSILFTNGYNFLGMDQNYINLKNLCSERKNSINHIILFNNVLSQCFQNSYRLLDDLYDVKKQDFSLCNSYIYYNYLSDTEENYDTFN